MLCAYWFNQPEVPVQYVNEPEGFCHDSSKPDNICGIILCLTGAPSRSCRGKCEKHTASAHEIIYAQEKLQVSLLVGVSCSDL